MKRPSAMQQIRAVRDWNERHPAGTPVTRYKLIYPRREPDPNPTKTSSEAWMLGGHTAVVMVEGHSGAVALESVVPI